MQPKTHRERLDAYMAECDSPIEIAHAAEHLGLIDRMGGDDGPRPTPAEVRAFLATLPVDVAEERLSELEQCPW